METPETQVNSHQTVAVILGASVFPRAPRLAEGRSFYTSAADFKDYVIHSHGLGLPAQNVSWLFDDSRSADDQLDDLSSFLSKRIREQEKTETPIQNLLLYYVGHGLFSRGDQAYCLAVRATKEASEGGSSIRMTDLATVVKDSAAFARRILILDCCFAATAFKEFQSTPLGVAKVQIEKEFPLKGTALFCSSSSEEPSLAPKELKRTMFTDALLKALLSGHPSLGPRMTTSELGIIVGMKLREYSRDWVRPQVLSPDQSEGDIAGVPIFPNPAYKTSAAWRMEVAEIIASFPDINDRVHGYKRR